MNLWSGAKLNSFLCDLRAKETLKGHKEIETEQKLKTFQYTEKHKLEKNFKEILRRQKNGQMPLRTELTQFGFKVKSDHLVSPLIHIESFFINAFLHFFFA